MENIELFTSELSDHIITILKGERFKENFKLIVSKEFSYILDSEKEVFFKSEAYDNFRTNVTKQILEAAQSEHFKRQLTAIINQNISNLEKSKDTLAEIFPPSFTNSIKVYIYNESPKLSASIKSFINSPKAQSKLKEEISNSINSFNPMAAKFINVNSIYTKILASINSYFDNPSNIMDIVNGINSGIDNFMKKSVSEFFVYFPQEGRNAIVDSLCSTVIDNLFTESFISSSLRNIEERFFADLNCDNNSPFSLTVFSNILVSKFIDDYYDMSLKMDNTKELITIVSGEIVNQLLEMPLKNFLVQ